DGIVKSWRWLVHGLLEEHDQLEDSLGSAWDLWVTHIIAAIAPIKAHITVQDSSGKERGWAADLGATAYSALVIEIFNDVATNTPWRRCANDNCRLLFARQHGRSAADQHRTTGVIYC